MWKNWKNRFRHIVTFWLVKNLLKAVHADEILVHTSQGLYIGKRRLSPEEIGFLKADAKQFLDSFLWRMIRREIRFMAYMRGSSKARTDADLIFSSAMYYNLELLEEFMKRSQDL